MSTAEAKPGSPTRWLFPLAMILCPYAAIPAAIAVISLNHSRNGRGPTLTFTQIKSRFPRAGLGVSAAIHAAAFVLLLYPPIARLLSPPRIIEVSWNDLSSTPVDSDSLAKFYYSTQTTAQPAPSPAAKDHVKAEASHGNHRSHVSPARHVEPPAPATYSGPQEVVSISANPTNSIQTILRPDLISPPVLKFPQLLKPVVMTRASLPDMSAINASIPTAPNVKVELAKDAPVPAPDAKMVPTAPTPNKSQPQSLPQNQPAAAARGPIDAIVINAVTVPDNAPVAIPEAELAGSFAVRPVRSSAGSGSDEGSAGAFDATKASGKAGQKGTGEAVAPGSETLAHKGGVGPGASIATSAGVSATASISTAAGSTTRSSNGRGSSQVTGTSQAGGTAIGGQASHGGSGITIIGGSTRDRGMSGSVAAAPPKYGLTVISSGSNGGASRDLGVFDRSETVYTVYIPMADAGGGPDWSMQYAILGPKQAGNGLLTPPAAVKKVRAVVTGDSQGFRTNIVFFSAVISDKGELTVNPPRQMDPRTQAAMDALRQWEFLPAQLNGIAVRVKILVGVGLVAQ